MAPITINRTPWGTLIDDPGNNLEGSLWDKNQIKVVLLDPIDVALAKVPVDVATGKIPDTALSANVALLNRVNSFTADQTIQTGNFAAVGTQAYFGPSTPVYMDNVLNVRGGKIAFPATQVAAADPNTLDDYEEGTWAPGDASG